MEITDTRHKRFQGSVREYNKSDEITKHVVKTTNDFIEFTNLELPHHYLTFLREIATIIGKSTPSKAPEPDGIQKKNMENFPLKP